MTQPENGGVQAADVQPNGGADTDVQTQLDEMKAQLEALKKESAGKDNYFKEQTAAYERKEAFRQAFKEIGLNPDEFIEIVDEKEPKLQAEKFATLLKERSDESVKKALEDFKTKELEKKGGVPQTTDKTVVKTHADVNALIRGAFNR